MPRNQIERPAKPAAAAYKRHLPHLQISGIPVFITFNTKDRWNLPEAIRAKILDHILHNHPTKYVLHAAVVMPGYVHVLLTPNRDPRGATYGLVEIIQAIKSASAHTVNRALGRKGAVWQQEYFDRLLRSDEKLREKAQYICANPVRAGLVACEDDWPWLWREWMEGGKDR